MSRSLSSLVGAILICEVLRLMQFILMASPD